MSKRPPADAFRENNIDGTGVMRPRILSDHAANGDTNVFQMSPQPCDNRPTIMRLEEQFDRQGVPEAAAQRIARRGETRRPRGVRYARAATSL
jgi:hypothetical protein